MRTKSWTHPRIQLFVHTSDIGRYQKGQILSEVKEYLADGGFEQNERMFPVTKNFLYHKMRRGSRTAGVKAVRVHDLRRSHVSPLIDLGFNALAIADRMGYEATDITYRYADLSPNVQADMAKALDSIGGK